MAPRTMPQSARLKTGMIRMSRKSVTAPESEGPFAMRSVKFPNVPFIPGQAYTIESAGGVLSLDMSTSSEAQTVDWTAGQLTMGLVKMEYYGDIGGTTVGELTGNAKYPNSPDGISALNVSCAGFRPSEPR